MSHGTSTLDDSIALPDAPAIEGLRYRAFRGAEDYPGMVDVATAASAADGEDDGVTVETMAHEYAHLTNCDPRADAIVAELDGRIVGYGRVEWLDGTDGVRSYSLFCNLHPEVRRRGIGRPMLHRNEARLREIAAAHPKELPRTFRGWNADLNEGAAQLFRQEGYRPVRRFFEMVRPTLDDITDAPLPEGLELRPVSPDQLRTIFDADVEAFQDHWGEVDGSDEGFVRWMEDPRTDPSLWQVAWDGDEVAGFVINQIDPVQNERHGYHRGWLDSVATRRPWRRRGLARALIGRSFHALRERGMTSAVLGVDAENPNEALALYRNSGFEIHRSYTVFDKPLE